MFEIGDLKDKIRRGDLVGFQAVVEANPQVIKESFPADDVYCSGFAIHYAAHHNQPEIIKWLVDVCGQDPNVCHLNSGSQLRPLHFAKRSNAYEAAGQLLMLGADPSLKGKERDKGDNISFSQSPEVKAVMDPEYLEKKIQKERAGTWKKTTSKEVIHDYKLSEQNLHLTEVFNFETRRLTIYTESLKTKTFAQETIFFDHIPDTTILKQALEELKKLGCDVDEGAIKGKRSLGKGKLGLQRKNQCP